MIGVRTIGVGSAERICMMRMFGRDERDEAEVVEEAEDDDEAEASFSSLLSSAAARASAAASVLTMRRRFDSYTMRSAVRNCSASLSKQHGNERADTKQ